MRMACHLMQDIDSKRFKYSFFGIPIIWELLCLTIFFKTAQWLSETGQGQKVQKILTSLHPLLFGKGSRG